MSRYEVLHTELGPLTRRQHVVIMLPTVITAMTIGFSASNYRSGLALALAALLLLPLLLHFLYRRLFPAYSNISDRRAAIRGELHGLDKRITAIFAGYRDRQQGEHFKKAYELAGRPLRDLEEALSVGMFREQREVFVTAFMRQGIAVRVTASIGSPMRCSAADNPARWKEHLERLGCDEIRQYHNHPVHDGHTSPSRTDVRTSKTLRKLLGPHGARLRSLIICWNAAREWKVFEHDTTGKHWLHFEFDAAASHAPPNSGSTQLSTGVPAALISCRKSSP